MPKNGGVDLHFEHRDRELTVKPGSGPILRRELTAGSGGLIKGGVGFRIEPQIPQRD